MRGLLAGIFACVLLLPAFSHAQIFCGHGVAPCGGDSIQGGVIENQQATAAANTQVQITLAAAPGFRHFLHHFEARCSGGTSTVTITDNAVTIYTTVTGEIGVVNTAKEFATALSSGAVNTAMVITLATCGVGNTGTLMIQAERY